ncbi:PilN domain-containing protein [Rahnella woolbedingensis]|uniref:Fimbrial assembly protein n=1 Tax=Rahnella woolbedingensis TaxID=1510574 RepID=A0A419N5W6_9GAMM|nr:PilN domain-containing protein [Rahnella woolbedingensis]RJT42149.1 fimbrial assembly protein [Rahnella woolbedingensis]
MLQVNLLPWRKLRLQRRSRYWLKMFICFPAVVTIAFMVLTALLIQERALLQLHLSALNASVQGLSRQQQDVSKAAAQVKTLKAQKEAAFQQLTRSRDYLQLLELIAAQIPAEVRLTEMTEHQEALTLKGEGRFYHDILSFRDVLAVSGLLGNVSLSDVQQQPGQMLSFVMKTQFQSARPMPDKGRAR